MIDIVIPNYNKYPYIKECLNSLVSQTYTNWRCIVVDSFSNDGSWEVIQEFSKNDKRFELYQIPKSVKSFYETWNFGLSQVKNEFFCVLTSDDIWPDNWLQTAIESLVANHNAVCAAARTKIIDANSKVVKPAIYNIAGERFFMKYETTPGLREGMVSSIACYFIGPIYTSIHSLLMRSEILKQDEKFAEDVGSAADYEWYIRLGFHGDIVYHPEIEVGWRFYEGQETKPREQINNYRLLQKIHLRTRKEIAKRLEDRLAEKFIKMAEEYDSRILTYQFARPYLVNLLDKPKTEIPRLLSVLWNRPKDLLNDFLFKIKGKNFLIEESLATAEQFYNFYNNFMRKNEIKNKLA